MISILMPIYNGHEFFHESYSSILNQTFENWELLIGINGHQKDSNVFAHIKSISASNKKTKIFQFDDIKNKSITLNRLIKECNYDIVCLLDVDDIWKENKLKHQIKYIKKYDVVGTDCKYFGERFNKPHLPFGLIDKKTFMSYNPIINSSSMFYKKDAFWNESINALDDYEMWLRLNKEGKTFYNIQEELCLHRVYSSSFYNSKDNSDIEKKLKDTWYI
jgi:teichuronic acid biosynthesis glycosyltransferase TuaG